MQHGQGNRGFMMRQAFISRLRCGVDAFVAYLTLNGRVIVVTFNNRPEGGEGGLHSSVAARWTCSLIEVWNNTGMMVGATFSEEWWIPKVDFSATRHPPQPILSPEALVGWHITCQKGKRDQREQTTHTHSPTMATNSIKLLTGNSHPVLASLVAER
jgi:hypothetical protein